MSRGWRRVGGWPAALLVGLFAARVAVAGNGCTLGERQAADELLFLDDDASAAAIARVAPWGLPEDAKATDDDHVLVQRDYALGYDAGLRVARWAEHRLERGAGKGPRLDCFRTDPRLPKAIAAEVKDFEEPIFDQGHLVPNGDMSFEKGAMLNTFIMSNMAPQFCQFNRGVWQILEDLIRAWAKDHSPLYVVTGAVFDRDDDGSPDADDDAVRMRSKRGRARVGVPSAFYKVLAYKTSKGHLETLAVLLPHDQTDLDGAAAKAYLARHITLVAEIERMTGLHFFPEWPGALHERTSLWPNEHVKVKSLAFGPCRKTAGATLTRRASGQDEAPRVYALPALSPE